MTMTTQAYVAVKAAKNFNNWGRYATQRFVEKCAVSPRLFRIARQCEATKGEVLFERRQNRMGSLNGLI